MKLKPVPETDTQDLPYVQVTLTRDEVASILHILHREHQLTELYNALLDFKRMYP